MTRARWSKSDIKTLCDMVAQGKTYTAIAKVLGKSVSSTRNKGTQLNLHYGHSHQLIGKVAVKAKGGLSHTNGDPVAY